MRVNFAIETYVRGIVVLSVELVWKRIKETAIGTQQSSNKTSVAMNNPCINPENVLVMNRVVMATYFKKGFVKLFLT